MNNEIKEILDDLRTYKDRYEYFLFNNLSFSDRDYKANILLDYITNLKQENENTKKLKERYQLEKEIYKSRCEKALHLIKHNDIYDYRVFEEKLENILNGDDENGN